VGYHKNIQVTAGYKDPNIEKFSRVSNPAQIVSQVFVPALNLGTSKYGKNNLKVKDYESKCKFVLKAAYTAAYLTAIANNHSQLYLTMIGSNLNNPIEWIYDAILEAHLQWGLHPNSNLGSVKLILNDESPATLIDGLIANNINYKLFKSNYE